MSKVKDPMWCMVMFDLPVLTAADRRNANAFRAFLIDKGFCKLQYSVYIKYTPLAGGDNTLVKLVRAAIPPNGWVHILHLTDRQWASTLRFLNTQAISPPEEPQQLMIF